MTNTYEIIVAGVVITTIVGTREDAEKALADARKSPLGWVHCFDSFRIREV